MSLIFLRLRLLYFLFSFAFDLSAFFIQRVRVLLWSFVLFLMIICAGLFQFIQIAEKTAHLTISSVGLPKEFPHEVVKMTKHDVEQRIQISEKLLQLQPSSRDVLINTALLYLAVNNTDKSQGYWQKAQQLDPNNQLFSQEK